MSLELLLKIILLVFVGAFIVNISLENGKGHNTVLTLSAFIFLCLGLLSNSMISDITYGLYLFFIVLYTLRFFNLSYTNSRYRFILVVNVLPVILIHIFRFVGGDYNPSIEFSLLLSPLVMIYGLWLGVLYRPEMGILSLVTIDSILLLIY